MNEAMEMIEAFWDDFSTDYDAIQEESLVDIPEHVKKFLAREGLLPCDNLLDLAGGTGKYIPALSSLTKDYHLVDLSQQMLKFARNKKCYSEKMTLIHQEQRQFLEQTSENTYDLVFTAMNPALDDKELLLEMNRISKKYVGILRMTFDEDNLFSQVEQLFFSSQEQASGTLMANYKEWLKQLGWTFKSKTFRFLLSEKVSAKLFSDYFSDELSSEDLNRLLSLFFGEKKDYEMQRLVLFELIYWEKH